MKIKRNRHKCRNCGRVRQERFMFPFVAMEHGVAIEILRPELKTSRTEWECGDCEENSSWKTD